MIVGTAGHVDHGKTSLVRALTGVDTDRLKEEKSRGISIELGYAYVPLPGNDATDAARVLGFVDVPGHERFVHTMVAGATGIDFALLVVAADDGVMPQTREHLAILELTGVRRGAVAITKVDRVDAARLEQVRDDLAALLGDTPLAEAPMFACNALAADDGGVAALRDHLFAAAAEQGTATPAADELFRMPVDRIFSLPGHGTMVAGPVAGGRVEAGSEARLMPLGIPVRVRGLHAQNRPVQVAVAGQRAALNLAGLAREPISRGDWVADPRAFEPGPRIDARLRLLDHGTILRDGAELHVHWGSSHRLARVLLLEDADPRRGVLVQLVFDAPVCAMTGDRFILRDASATRTIGGGVLLDPEAPQRRRRSAARQAWLRALEAMLDGGGIAPLLQQAPLGLPLATLARRCRLPEAMLALPADVVRVGDGDGAHVIDSGHWQALAERAEAGLAQWHERRPDEPGVDAPRLMRIIVPNLDAGVWRARLEAMRADGRAARKGPWWHLPGHDPRLSDAELARLQALMAELLAGGFDPPWVRTLATQMTLDEDQVRKLLCKAAAQGRVYQVVPDLFYHPQRIAELAAVVAALADEHGSAEAAPFRDAIGIGRKRSIQILEFFDRVGYTRRVGAGHKPRQEMRWDTLPATQAAG
ncbi:MAG: selenocysteine-specific translation elongation factor [Pseudoxanthomonas suwonensis]|nr:selenocysteine-specific translation elongation factor [Pseudoxanthomonas suwonensis]